jgi:hypothetical protein
MFSSPAVVGGIVYVGSVGNMVYALNATTGAQVWSYPTGREVFSSPAVADGVVYVGSEDHNVYALDATTGAKIWNYTTGSWVDSSPAVVDGVVYVGSGDYKLYAFGTVHDVAVTNVVSSKDGCLPMPTVGQGFSANISITVANFGSYQETFNLTLYATIFIVQQNVTLQITSQNVTLESGNYASITFVVNTAGYPYGNYTISAYAWPVPGETNTADNNFTDGTVEVTIPGDVNGDGRVNILDAILVSNAFLATSSSSDWNPNADIDGNGWVNILDSIILSNNWTG